MHVMVRAQVREIRRGNHLLPNLRRHKEGQAMNELTIIMVLAGVTSAYLWGYNIGKRGLRREEAKRIWDDGHEEGYWDAFRAPEGYNASRAWRLRARRFSNPYRKPGGEGA
jgi:hypothetical protein